MTNPLYIVFLWTNVYNLRKWMLSTSQDYHYYYSWITDPFIMWSTSDSIPGMCQFLSLVCLGFVIGVKTK